MSETKKHEECSFCGEYTGRAGKGDDSIYINGIGPYCELCADITRKDLLYNPPRLRNTAKKVVGVK